MARLKITSTAMHQYDFSTPDSKPEPFSYLFGIVQCYSTSAMTTKQAVSTFAAEMQNNGYHVDCYDSSTLTVDGVKIQVCKHPGWSKFDIRQI